jgi:hypothetical protein
MCWLRFDQAEAAMWVIIPVFAIIVGGLVAFLTRDWRRAVLVGAVSGLLGALFVTFLIYSGIWGG